MKHSTDHTSLTDSLGIGAVVLGLYLGIPGLALHLAWAGGEAPVALLMAAVLVGTACSAWRDLERGHVGKLTGSLSAASLAALLSVVWPAL